MLEPIVLLFFLLGFFWLGWELHKEHMARSGPSKSPSTAPVQSAVASIHHSAGEPAIPVWVTVQWLSARSLWEIKVSWAGGSTSRILVDGSLPQIQELYVHNAQRRKDVWLRIR